MKDQSKETNPNHEHVVEELNGLIQESLKLVDGYQLAADRLNGTAYQETCRHFVDDYRKLVGELQQRVSALGERPAQHSSLSAFLLTNTIRFKDYQGDHVILKTMADTEVEVAERIERAKDMAKNKKVKQTLALGGHVANIHRDWLRRELAYTAPAN